MVRRRRAVVEDDRLAEDEMLSRREVVERPPWSPAQFVALAIGVIFTVIGGIALSKTGVDSGTMNTINADGPLWNHTAWLAIGEILFGLMMIGAGVVPGGARGLMTFLGILALAFGIAVLVAPNDLRTEEGAGWAFIVAAAITLLASAVSPVFFTGDRVRYNRRREVVA